MSQSKGEIRAYAQARRATLRADQRAAGATALRQALLPLATGRVAAYASAPTEPGTAPLLAALREAGVEVLLPVLRPDNDLDWALFEDELVAGLRGTRQPPGPLLGRDAITDCRLVVVPALAVDHAGTRLGRGGGSYDRALSRANGYVVAALFVGELHDRLPAEPHDRPVHGVVLPDRGLVQLRAHDLRQPELTHPLDRPVAAPDGMTQ